MRIVIDMQGAQSESRFRGIGRYTISFVKALLDRNDGLDEIILLLNGSFPESIRGLRKIFSKSLPEENIRVWHSLAPSYEWGAKNSWQLKASQIIRDAFIEDLNPDILIETSLFEGYLDNSVTSIPQDGRNFPVAVIFYDLIPLIFSDIYLEPNPEYKKFYYEKINHLRRANLYLAISKTTASDGVRKVGLNPKNITCISSGYSKIFQPIDKPREEINYLFDKFNITKPYFLYTGGADHRKNLSVLIEAFSLLPSQYRKSFQLVFAGKIPESEMKILSSLSKKYELCVDSIVFTDYISDDDLVGLYSFCEMYVFPSLYEGFGLPVLEAMASGAPVITSGISSLFEVVGEESLFFDPNSAVSIANLITRVMDDDELRKKIKDNGLNRVKQFSWEAVAEKAMLACQAHVEQYSKVGQICKNQLLEKLINDLAALSLDYPEIKFNKLSIASVIAKNHPSHNRKPKLFIDISELAQRDARTGIQRVVRSITRELLINPPLSHEVIPIYGLLDKSGYRVANHFLKTTFPDNYNIDVDYEIDPQPGDIFLGLDLQHHVVRAQCKYLEYMHNLGVKVYFVVYDLLPVLLPNAFPPGSNDAHIKWLMEITKFNGVICISKAVADELSDWLIFDVGLSKEALEINWFHLGSDIENSNPSKGISEGDKVILDAVKKRHTFLMVGTIEPRKGHKYVLEQFIDLWSVGVDINLVIVGKKGWAVESIVNEIQANQEYGKKLFWLNGVSDECLEEVYRLSTCLIAASYGEGFGLPIIEAARFKLPIIARDIPVFREVGGEGVYFFPNKEHPELSGCILHWLKLLTSGSAPSSQLVPLLSWSQSSSQLLNRIGLISDES